MNTNIHFSLKVALVVFAHNESFIIQRSVLSASKALECGDAIFVIADGCTDDTARLAKQAGAQVLIREGVSSSGKGAALAWFIKYHWNAIKDFSRLVILDADTYIEPDFIMRIKTQKNNTDQVLQCFVSPCGYEGAPISSLIALSEIVEQSIFDRIRSLNGWSVRLRGTGMVISPQQLASVSERVQTEVEDIALTLLFAEKNIHIQQLAVVAVHDPKPMETTAASRQRARWFRGQWSALWTYRGSILKIIGQGPSGWLLINSLFLKPRWLMMVIKIILAIAFNRLPFLAAFFWLLASSELILFFIGILRIKEKQLFLKAIIHFPEFIFMWLKGIVLSLKQQPWLRVRETQNIQDDCDPDQQPFSNSPVLHSNNN
jgi:cellulose synthase/poly-beta-1,6-N-acetylglucosamine synthase-like glycosyltransferase